MSAGPSPLVGPHDRGAKALIIDLLGQALRPVRIRFVNRIGADVPLTLGPCEFMQLASLHDRLYAQEVRLLSRVRLSPSGVPLLIGLDTPLLFRLMGMLMGESPWEEPAPVDSRALTATDLRLARRVLDDLVGGLEEGLPDVNAQKLVIEAVTDDPRLDLGLVPSTGMYRTTIEVGDPDNPLGKVILGLPTSVVPVLYPDRPVHVGEDRRQRGEARVLPIRVDAVAELGRVRMALSQVQELGVGDTLNLGRLRQIQVRVRDRVALIAEPGVVDGVRCVRVLRNVHDVGASG